MDAEKSKFLDLLRKLRRGSVNIITGNNGSGKSRFFAFAASEVCNSYLNERRYSQLLCLSGTHLDKFPKEVWHAASDSFSVCYLGYKVANNMISDMAPFRVIVQDLLGRNYSRERQPEAIEFCIAKLNITSKIKLHFRYARNKKSNLLDFAPKEMELDLLNFADTKDTLAIAYALARKELLLQTISVCRNGRYHMLSDLSSGERAYMIALLGALYCTKHDSIILFDEPENSLHPAWQKDIVRDFRQVLELNNVRSTVLLATHSPLIAASISNREAFTCNFPAGQDWQASDLFGKTTDSTLKDQFKLYTSRSADVISVAQSCLDYIGRGELKSADLFEKIDTLLSFGLAPEKGDPMFKVLKLLSYVRLHGELP